MYKICKTESSAKRQKEIELCLLNVMNTKKYEDITITELCEKMNMPRKSFYRYFDGKDGAMQSLLYHTMEEFDTIRLVQRKSRLSEEFEDFFSFWKSKKELLDAFYKSGFIGLLMESATNYAMKEFGDVEKYLSDSGRNEKILAYQFVICGLMTMMINWYRTGFSEPISSISHTAAKIITNPLFEKLTRPE